MLAFLLCCAAAFLWCYAAVFVWRLVPVLVLTVRLQSEALQAAVVGMAFA